MQGQEEEVERKASVKLGIAVATFEDLKVEMSKRSPNDDLCGKLLNKLKLMLAEVGLLIPTGEIPDPRFRQITRDFLEIGALYSLKAKDIPSFERYLAQLKGYYKDFSPDLPESPKMYMLLGLNLLRLLSQNRIAEFHTELELIDAKQLHENPFIKHPVEIEQCLMEGSYNKVVKNRESVPAREFLFFIDILLETIRQEIAKCSEKTYDSLPISSGAKMMYFNNQDKFLEFASSRGWEISTQTGMVYFRKEAKSLSRDDISSISTMKNTLFYARELEKIV